MSYAVTHLEDIAALKSPGEVPMRPVRLHLGITGFGANAFTAENAGDRIINEHDEDGDDPNEELYIVTRGHATFELDGETRDAPEGTLVFAEGKVKRTAVAEEAGTTIICVGGTPGKPYNPQIGWELWYPLRKLHQAGKLDEVVARGRELAASNPRSGLLFFNLACCESLTGDKAEALEHLRTAIELWPEFRDYAKNDSDLDAIRGDPAFQELLAE